MLSPRLRQTCINRVHDKAACRPLNAPAPQAVLHLWRRAAGAAAGGGAAGHCVGRLHGQQPELQRDGAAQGREGGRRRAAQAGCLSAAAYLLMRSLVPASCTACTACCTATAGGGRDGVPDGALRRHGQPRPRPQRLLPVCGAGRRLPAAGVAGVGPDPLLCCSCLLRLRSLPRFGTKSRGTATLHGMLPQAAGLPGFAALRCFTHQRAVLCSPAHVPAGHRTGRRGVHQLRVHPQVE